MCTIHIIKIINKLDTGKYSEISDIEWKAKKISSIALIR